MFDHIKLIDHKLLWRVWGGTIWIGLNIWTIESTVRSQLPPQPHNYNIRYNQKELTKSITCRSFSMLPNDERRLEKLDFAMLRRRLCPRPPKKIWTIQFHFTLGESVLNQNNPTTTVKVPTWCVRLSRAPCLGDATPSCQPATGQSHAPMVPGILPCSWGIKRGGDRLAPSFSCSTDHLRSTFLFPELTLSPPGFTAPCRTSLGSSFFSSHHPGVPPLSFAPVALRRTCWTRVWGNLPGDLVRVHWACVQGRSADHNLSHGGSVRSGYIPVSRIWQNVSILSGTGRRFKLTSQGHSRYTKGNVKTHLNTFDYVSSRQQLEWIYG